MEIGTISFKCTKCGKELRLNANLPDSYDTVRIGDLNNDLTSSRFPVCYGMHKCHDTDDQCGFFMAYTFTPSKIVDNSDVDISYDSNEIVPGIPVIKAIHYKSIKPVDMEMELNE